MASAQIIADHTVVDKYHDIPQYYIDKVKKMWLVYAGESHSGSMRAGLTALEALSFVYAVSVKESGTPEGYTTANLRASRATWGDVNNSTGWIYGYGEEDWYKTGTAIARTKAGISYCDANNLTISAFGFGWCWDEAETNMTPYLNATQEYINYCASNSINTRVFFTTGPVDAYTAAGQIGYSKYLAHEAIRNYVKNDPDRILFDFADILCYNSGSETPNSTTWDGHIYPIITSANLNPIVDSYHFSAMGALRLAQAMWWLLARIAGWSGVTTVVEDISLNEPKIWTHVNGDELTVHIPEKLTSGKLELYSIDGSLKAISNYESSIFTVNISELPSGFYVMVFNHSAGIESKKIILP